MVPPTPSLHDPHDPIIVLQLLLGVQVSVLASVSSTDTVQWLDCLEVGLREPKSDEPHKHSRTTITIEDGIQGGNERMESLSLTDPLVRCFDLHEDTRPSGKTV